MHLYITFFQKIDSGDMLNDRSFFPPVGLIWHWKANAEPKVSLSNTSANPILPPLKINLIYSNRTQKQNWILCHQPTSDPMFTSTQNPYTLKCRRWPFPAQISEFLAAPQNCCFYAGLNWCHRESITSLILSFIWLTLLQKHLLPSLYVV